MSARSSAFRPQSARSSAFRPRSATQLGPRNNRSPTPDNELVKALLCKFIEFNRKTITGSNMNRPEVVDFLNRLISELSKEGDLVDNINSLDI